jgi:hypothetical protein
MRPKDCRCLPGAFHLSTFRLTTALGLVAFFFAFSTARADKDFGASAGAEEVIAGVAGDYNQDSATLNVVSGLGDILTNADLDSFLNASGWLEAAAAALDLDTPDAAGQAPEAVIATLAGTGTGKGKTIGLLDLASAGVLLIGTALTSFAFFARRKHRHSRRIYFAKSSAAPAKNSSPQTSPSADSSEPHPLENSGHSSPRRRLA